MAVAIGRTRWAISHLFFAITGSAVAILAAGFVTGLGYGIAVDDFGGKLRTVQAVAATQLPAIWMLAAVTVALFGLIPRFTPVAWGVLVAFVAVYLLGPRVDRRVPALAARPGAIHARTAGSR